MHPDFFRKECSILNFLPQSESMKVKNIREAISIIDILDKLLFIFDSALNSLINKNYKDFDPLVGENSCQIRGYMIYYFYSNKMNISNPHKLANCRREIKRILFRLKEAKDCLLNSKKNIFSEKTSVSLKEFIFDNSFQVFFPVEIVILLKMYFLSKYTISNEQGIHVGINYDAMFIELIFSKTLSRRIIHLYQVDVSRISCFFVKTLSHEISHHYPEYEQIINLLIFRDDDNRFVLPCYLSMDILLKHMSMYNTFIIINMFSSQKKLSIENNIANISYNLGSLDKESPVISQTIDDALCVVFRGMSSMPPYEYANLLRKLSNMDIKNVLLSSTARHSQYPGKRLNFLKNNPFSAIMNQGIAKKEKNCLIKIEKEFFLMKKKALQDGCCLESHFTFFSTHIFCDTLNNYMPISFDEVREHEMSA